MKFLIAICSLLTVAVAQDPSISCRYFFDGVNYGCDMSIDNPNGFNGFTEIGGTHLEGYTNDDVDVIYRGNGTTTNIPQIICATFPNILDFEIYGSFISEINDGDLSGCTRVRSIWLHYNVIRSVSPNAFANLPEAMYINLADNQLTTLPENVFANQRNLTELSLSYNPFSDIPTGLFRPLENLMYLYMAEANLTAVNSQWFTTNSNLNHINLAYNRIALTSGSFAGLQQLRYLSLVDNGISEIPDGTFTGLPNLESLQLYFNRFTTLRANSFPNLGQLTTMDISLNPLQTIEDGAFQGLGNLRTLYLSSSGLRDLNPNSFLGLGNLTYLDLNFNSLEDIRPGTFVPMPNLEYIGLWSNRLKTMRRNSFGTLTELRTFDLDGNIVNALDQQIIDDAVNLNTLYFNGNLCANNFFGSFMVLRATYLPMLERCFRNMRYIVDVTTESDGIYSFFEGPDPGIVLRVQADNEVQIALTPFEFLWDPSVEILIGTANNTRSVIRINEDTDVVTVPSQNILQPNQWNDFRITWANQNVLVFRSNDTYPFMSYTMQQFFPVNFYGLRAVETSATWSVQPVD